MTLTPNSYGVQEANEPRGLREFNSCHEPAGTAKGGQFCGKDRALRSRTVVGITTARPASDAAHYRTNRQIGDDLRAFERQLSAIKGVSGAEVRPAVGQWDGGSEFSWSVRYLGNGEARKLIARVAAQSNQDAVLILRRPRPGETEDEAHEITFERPVGGEARKALGAHLVSLGFGGWTWYKRQGRTTLRLVTVPQWGGDPMKHRVGIRSLMDALRTAGRGARAHRMHVKVEVYEREGREGVPGYKDVLHAA